MTAKRIRSQLSFQLPPELIAEVKQAAIDQRRTTTTLVTEWIEAGLSSSSAKATDAAQGLSLDLSDVTLPDAGAAMVDAWYEAQEVSCDRNLGDSAGVRRVSLLQSLSNREREVLSLVADGSGNAEIGSQLGISVDTVKKHLKGLSSKLQARDRAHATAIGIRLGLI